MVKHWKEIATHPDIALSPNKAAYLGIEAQGGLRVYTARIDVELVGYAVYFVRHSLHYSDSLQAMQDVLFLRTDLRRGRVGRRLITYADEQLAGEGVQLVRQHVKVAHNFGPLLEQIGYELDEFIFVKRL
jgi:GNAT superfamily N-acetyltransferase